MKKPLILALCCALLLSACSDKLTATEKLMRNPVEVNITSIDDLNSVFKNHQYTSENWKKGVVEVPRVIFQKVSITWQKYSEKIPVVEKKSLFFRLMLPLILISNEDILHERKTVESADLASPQLLTIAKKYRVIKKDTVTLSNANRQELLNRINIIPPSLALAQAAEESGWGSSRFAREGNAFFGQWVFNGSGIKPKQQRKELGNYGIARFDSPLASVKGYMLNINSSPAYQGLRNLRAKEIAEGKSSTGMALAGTLHKYSERGEAYIVGLRHLMSYNKLQGTDNSYLSNNQLVSLIPQ